MEPITWTSEPRKVKDLIPYKSNPRQISKDQLAQLKRSLEKFDYAELIAVQRDNTIIAGHMRVKAMMQLGWGDREILVRVPRRPLSEDEMREYLIRSNKNTGEWDWDILANEWDPHELHDWGFSSEELVDDVLDLGSTEEDNEVLEPPKDPKTKLGDIYQLGSHRLICGDSTNPAVVSSLLKDDEPILMVTDPPYGIQMDKGFSGKVGFSGKGKPIKRRKYDDKWDSKKINDEYLNDLISFSKMSIIWGGNFYAHCLPPSTHWLVWDKKQTMPTFGDCELAWTNSERKSVKKYEIEYNGLIGKEENRFHPTQKPVKLFYKIIEDYSKENELIFDPFLGSGTTLIAAENLQRTCYGIELDPAYCDIIVERWVKTRKKNGKDYEVLKNGEICEDFND